MIRTLFGGATALLLPFATHAAAPSAGAYTGAYLRADASEPANALRLPVAVAAQALRALQPPTTGVPAHGLDITSHAPVTELVVVDTAVDDLAVLQRALRPGVQLVTIDAQRPGLPQLVQALQAHRNLAAIHVVSHAEAGVLRLGSSRITAETVRDELQTLSALRQAVRPGADLLFYGCDLAANADGEALLDIVHQATGMDVAASNNLTGNAAQGGDWELEIHRGDIEAPLAFSDKALADFSQVLVASNGTKTFAQNDWQGWYSGALTNDDFRLTSSLGADSYLFLNSVANSVSAMSYSGEYAANPQFFELQVNSANTRAFELTGVVGGVAPGMSSQFANIRVEGTPASGAALITSTGLSSTETVTFAANELVNFAGVPLKSFKLLFDCVGGCSSTGLQVPNFEFRSFTITNATNATVDTTAPSVSSITPNSGPAATSPNVSFTVTFNEGVTDVDINDFQLTTTSSAAGNITSITGSGSTYIVDVSGITGNGTLRLDLKSSGTGIQDSAGNALTAGYSGGTVHTVAMPTAPGAPAISAATAGDGQATVTFAEPGSNGGAAITTYTATASPGGATGSCAGPAACTITVGSLTNGTSYTFVVTAKNGAGTGSASGASNAVMPMANQTISFAQPINYPFGATPTLTASSKYTVSNSATGFAIAFTSSTTGVCTITSGGALTFLTAGTCTIEANHPGNTSTNAAVTVPRSFTVNAVAPGAPTIGTATPGDTQATVTFSAPASTGGAAINASGYTVTASPGGATGTGSSSPITVTGLTNGVSYTFTATATNSAGTGTASAASNTVTPAAPQTITFNQPAAQNFGTTPTFSATSNSGLSPTFTSSTTPVCTITTGGTLTFAAVGSCTINADQAGNSSYLPATQVSRSFTVNAIVAGAPTSVVATAGDSQASVAFVAPTNKGGTTITGYTVTVSPADVMPVNGAGSPIVVDGLTNGQAYTFTVTAKNSAGTGPASSPSNSVTPAATQTITFNQPAAQNFGTTPTFSATSNSSLSPTFTSSTTPVCTITTGGTLTFAAVGTCTINADQAGNSNYLPATQVSRSFTVNAVVPGAPTMGAATAGNAKATVNFSAPAMTGGAVITGYTATATPGGATASGAASPLSFTGLTNDTVYTFKVTATNSAGTGSPSVASSDVTPKAWPVVSSLAVPASASYNVGEHLDFTINWGQPVVVTGTPEQAVVIGSTTVQGTYLDQPTPSTMRLRYTVLNGQSDSDGIALGALSLPNGATIQSTSGLNAVLTLNNVAATTGVLVSTQPIANAVGLIVPVNSAAFPIALNITGGTPTSVALVGTAAHGTVSVSGLGLVYTPTAGYTGTDTVSYTATNAQGTSNTAAVTIAIPVQVATGTVPALPGTGAGAAPATVAVSAASADGGTTCHVASAQVANTLPPGATVSYGTLKFAAEGCTAQGSITLTLDYSQPLPADVQFMKYGPKTAGATTLEWFEWPSVTISANRQSVQYTVVDQGVGDSNPTPGLIDDPLAVVSFKAAPVTPVTPTPTTPTPVPVNAPWALALLGALLGALGWRQQARQQERLQGRLQGRARR